MQAELVQVFVPYEVETGKVYLNGIGGTLEAASRPFSDGVIEVGGTIEFATGDLLFESGSHDADLFPCVVPVEVSTGKPMLDGIGSTETEARVNVEYAGGNVAEYDFVAGGLRMTLLLAPSLSSPTGVP